MKGCWDSDPGGDSEPQERSWEMRGHGGGGMGAIPHPPLNQQGIEMHLIYAPRVPVLVVMRSR